MMNEQVSALADGEIETEDYAKEIAFVLSDKKALQAWGDYQRIGDAMRSTSGLSADFTLRVMEKIELEPTVLAPNAITRSVIKSRQNATSTRTLGRLPTSWSIAASCAAVLVVGWGLMHQQLGEMTHLNAQLSAKNTTIPTENVAQSSSQIAAVQSAAQTPVAPLEYLAAHQVSAPSVGSYYIQAASYSE